MDVRLEYRGVGSKYTFVDELFLVQEWVSTIVSGVSERIGATTSSKAWGCECSLLASYQCLLEQMGELKVQCLSGYKAI